MKELQSHFIMGGTDLLPPVIVLILAWAIAGVTEDLGFKTFLTGLLGPALPAWLVPFIIFVIGGMASYFMGSSWGTWALVMPPALSVAVVTGASIPDSRRCPGRWFRWR